MGEKQPCRHQGQCRRSSRHTAAAPCSPGEAHRRAGHPPAATGITQSRSTHTTTEEPTVQQWMWPEGGTAHGEPPHKSSPWIELLSEGPLQEQCLKGRPRGTGVVGQSCSLWNPIWDVQ